MQWQPLLRFLKFDILSRSKHTIRHPLLDKTNIAAPRTLYSKLSWLLHINMVSPGPDLDDRPLKRRRVSLEAESEQEVIVEAVETDGALTITVVGESSAQESRPQNEDKGKDKNKGRRDRRATSYHKKNRGAESTWEGTETPAGPKLPRLPKRQCALLVGFCGSGYNGMQMYAIQLTLGPTVNSTLPVSHLH
jgi:hypothetical protein